MNPEQIQQLVRMAQEVESLERSAFDEFEAPAPIPFAAAADRFRAHQAPTSAARSFFRRAQPWLGLAACVGIVSAVFMNWQAPPVRPARTATPRVIASRPAPVKPMAQEPRPVAPPVKFASAPVSEPASAGAGCPPASEAMASVIFAISRDEDSGCRVGQRIVPHWVGHGSAEQFSRVELLRMGYEASSMAMPDRILVVSVSGPVELLASHFGSDAEDVMACIEGAKAADPETAQIVGDLGHDEDKYAAMARSCVAEGLSVQAVTLLGR